MEIENYTNKPTLYSIENLDFFFKNGQISRELRWSHMQDLLEEISKFLRIQHTRNIDLLIIDSDIALEFQITNFQKQRIRMLLDLNEIRSAPFITLVDGEYEPLIARIMYKLSANSSHFLDIGANMGFYALALATINPKLRVEAFEPLDQMYNTLIRNIGINNLNTRINTHKIGLSNSNFETTIFVPKFTGSSGASLMKLHPEEGVHADYPVSIRKLDDFNESLKEVDLLKIDVEGAELHVLQGAMNLIKNNKPTIMVELLRKWMKPFKSTPQDVVELLFELGYKAFAISSKRIYNINEINEFTEETNFFFCHPTQVKHYSILAEM